MAFGRKKQDEAAPVADEAPEPSPRVQEPPRQAPASVPSSSPDSEHPEILVGAAFVGGFALALIVKRLGR